MSWIRRLPLVSMIVVGLGCQTPRTAQPDPAPASEPIAKETDMSEQTPREISGIGIRPVIHADGFAIGQLFPGGPADQAGLHQGDVVLEVDGDPTARWTLERAASRLRGDSGTTVTLLAEREGERFEVRLSRRIIKVP
jgi:carboxyl-terminal processing protease